MISDSEGDDFEDASEFGVDDSEMFGMGSSTCRKSPMSAYSWIRFLKCMNVLDTPPPTVFYATSLCFQCQKTVRMKLMPYCTLLPNFLQGELSIILLL